MEKTIVNVSTGPKKSSVPTVTSSLKPPDDTAVSLDLPDVIEQPTLTPDKDSVFPETQLQVRNIMC